MNNILNAQDAFAALQNGKNLLCRYLESDFLPLDQFPGTVFGSPDYQFCIDIEKIELAGISFTKPCTIEELTHGQKIFVVNFSQATINEMAFKSNVPDANNLVYCGVVQRDLENAKLQMKAYHAFLGLDLAITISDVPDAGRKQPKKRESKKVDVDPQVEHNKDLVIDAIATCLTAEEVETTCYGLDGNGFTEAQQEQITAAKLAKLEQLAQEKAAAENEDHELFNQDNPELSVLCEAFIEDVEKCLSLEDLNSIRHRINANGVLTDTEHLEIAKHVDLKTASFDTVQPPADIEVNTAQENPERKIIEEEENKYQEKLITLKKHVDEAKTPAEVNAAVKYTNSWSAKQREPLIKYMHKRLEVLQDEKAAAQPSLMVQIQNAPDLTTLDALEIDVASLDPIAQPEMMRYIRTRRAELEASAGETSIDEDLP
ncbi:hypothetical protein MMP65_05840 [Acinetobacter sp. ANC 3926]|uniref:hypothetical protein n=1 Tax=Acinetobacter genomosp. 15BJ TaxID=106651 RepID=UPI001F4B3ED0|nr:hypothetical protein [Acinetobacter genomosp. 15BJ]MCH7290981.1 hypothetical protein [Acinetobacter genomosp. 15BJ]